MKAKPKAPLRTRKENRGEAAKFLWHLLPPFRERFDRDHWWLKPGESASSEAVIWELFRRHHKQLPPNVLQHNTEVFKPKELEPFPWEKSSRESYLLAAQCWYSWPNLDENMRKFFRNFLLNRFTPQKGFRPDSTTLLNEHRRKEIVMKLAAEQNPNKKDSYLRWVKFHGPRDRTLVNAMECDRKGHMLTAIDPRSSLTSIEEQVRDQVRTWRRVTGLKEESGKDHSPAWRAVIAEFEQRELSRPNNQIRDNQLFARYRRFVKNWNWPF